ncbi:MAG: YdcF family protein, partial [Rhodanobacter sp.]
MLTRLQAPYITRPALDWAPRNAIVLLTGGSTSLPNRAIEPSINAYGRIAEAAMLYNDCRNAGKHCTLLVTGGDPADLGTPLANTYAAVLQRLGIAPADLVLEPHSKNTWQNAQFSRPLLLAIGAQRIWLVSSAFHLRRSMLYFERF